MKLNHFLYVVLLLLGFPCGTAGQILPPDAQVERLARGFGFTEGPVYRDGVVLFTDLNQSDIISYDVSSGSTTVVDNNSGGANGLFFDANGQLIAVEGNRRQMTRRDANDVSTVEGVLADEWNGMRFNSPNDLVLDAAGGIYFTDPDYPNRRSQPEAVYYLNPVGELQQILSGFRRPNGIMLSPDGETLYLAVEQETKIMAYDVAENGLPTNERLFALTNVDREGNRIPGITNGPDGMTVDPSGNLYAAVQNEVWAWTPTGERLFELAIPENPTNVTFGGDDGKTLFITARTSLYGVELNIVPEPSSVGLAYGFFALLGFRRVRRRNGNEGGSD